MKSCGASWACNVVAKQVAIKHIAIKHTGAGAAIDRILGSSLLEAEPAKGKHESIPDLRSSALDA